jgi:hypothetical protein
MLKTNDENLFGAKSFNPPGSLGTPGGLLKPPPVAGRVNPLLMSSSKPPPWTTEPGSNVPRLDPAHEVPPAAWKRLPTTHAGYPVVPTGTPATPTSALGTRLFYQTPGSNATIPSSEDEAPSHHYSTIHPFDISTMKPNINAADRPQMAQPKPTPLGTPTIAPGIEKMGGPPGLALKTPAPIHLTPKMSPIVPTLTRPIVPPTPVPVIPPVRPLPSSGPVLPAALTPPAARPPVRAVLTPEGLHVPPSPPARFLPEIPSEAGLATKSIVPRDFSHLAQVMNAPKTLAGVNGRIADQTSRELRNAEIARRPLDAPINRSSLPPMNFEPGLLRGAVEPNSGSSNVRRLTTGIGAAGGLGGIGVGADYGLRRYLGRNNRGNREEDDTEETEKSNSVRLLMKNAALKSAFDPLSGESWKGLGNDISEAPGQAAGYLGRTAGQAAKGEIFGNQSPANALSPDIGNYLDKNRWANYAAWGLPIGAGVGLLGGLLNRKKRKGGALGDMLTGGLMGAAGGGFIGAGRDMLDPKPDTPPPVAAAPAPPVTPLVPKPENPGVSGIPSPQNPLKTLKEMTPPEAVQHIAGAAGQSPEQAKGRAEYLTGNKNLDALKPFVRPEHAEAINEAQRNYETATTAGRQQAGEVNPWTGSERGFLTDRINQIRGKPVVPEGAALAPAANTQAAWDARNKVIRDALAAGPQEAEGPFSNLNRRALWANQMNAIEPTIAEGAPNPLAPVEHPGYLKGVEGQSALGLAGAIGAGRVAGRQIAPATFGAPDEMSLKNKAQSFEKTLTGEYAPRDPERSSWNPRGAAVGTPMTGFDIAKDRNAVNRIADHIEATRGIAGGGPVHADDVAKALTSMPTDTTKMTPHQVAVRRALNEIAQGGQKVLSTGAAPHVPAPGRGMGTIGAGYVRGGIQNLALGGALSLGSRHSPINLVPPDRTTLQAMGVNVPQIPGLNETPQSAPNPTALGITPQPAQGYDEHGIPSNLPDQTWVKVRAHQLAKQFAGVRPGVPEGTSPQAFEAEAAAELAKRRGAK